MTFYKTGSNLNLSSFRNNKTISRYFFIFIFKCLLFPEKKKFAPLSIGSRTSRCSGIEPALTPFSGGSKTGLEKTVEIEPTLSMTFRIKWPTLQFPTSSQGLARGEDFTVE